VVRGQLIPGGNAHAFSRGRVALDEFAEDHLDRHGTMEAYFIAKWSLVKRTTPGHFFAGTSTRRYAAEFGSATPFGAGVATEQQVADIRLTGTVFADYPQRENFLLAAAWWRFARLDEDALYAAARGFRLGRHRLTRVAEHDGVAFCTIPRPPISTRSRRRSAVSRCACS